MRFFIFCALVSAAAVAADDTLYQQQRLQRQYQQQQLDLKRLQSRQRQGVLDAAEKLRTAGKHNRQLLRQRRLFQSQNNQIQRNKDSAGRLYEQQKFKRMQDSQALEFKWQKH